MPSKFYLMLMFLSGVVFMVGIGLFAHEYATPEWRKYQVEYKDFVRSNAKDEATARLAESMDIGIQQIYLKTLGRIDRCTSCHVGVENPMMAKAALPLRQHSGDYLKNHPADRFGCTVCHFGQGRATNKVAAHGLGHETHWDNPILPVEYVQSSCAQCHDMEMLKDKGGEMVVKGKKLFLERGCKGCHKLDSTGGVIGKALDGVGSQPIAYFSMKNVQGEKTVYTWMKQHFDDPRNIVPTSEMKTELTDQEAEYITNYVLSLRTQEIPKKYRRINTTPEAEKTGEDLYRMYCVACHADGKTSSFDEVFKRTVPAISNPAFLKAATNDYLKKVIEEGRAGTQMTAWKASAAGLTEAEIKSIVEYVSKDRPEQQGEPFGYQITNGDSKAGEDLFRVRCVDCHGKNGQGGIGLNLRNPVVQKEASPEFLATTIRDGREGTHMASFGKGGSGLSDKNIADIVAYIKTFSGVKK
ncbi:MAG: c-type cytochrome [Nitrospirae bacterium]|nr:c-type cytochrome [Nitrospirota bacterium]